MSAAASNNALGRAAPVIACISVVGIALGLLTPVLSLSMDRAGADHSEIGALSACGALGTILVGPLVPMISRRFGGRQTLLGAALLSLVLIPSFYAIADWHYWFGPRLILSFALTILFVISEVWINAVTPDAIRGRIMGIYAATLSGGFMIGPLILTAVGAEGALPFIVGTSLIAVAVIPILLHGGDLPRHETTNKHSMIGMVTRAPAIFAAAFAYGAIESGFFSLMPLHALGLGLDVKTMGLVLSAFAGGQVVLQIPIGYLSDRLDRQFMLMICGLIGVLGMAGMVLIGGQPVFLALLLFVWGGIVVGFYTVGLTLLGERYQGADLGAANAAFIALYGWGALIGPAFGGIAMDAYPAMGLPSVMGLISFLVLAPITRRWLGAPSLLRRT
jgi:MFS family permease